MPYPSFSRLFERRNYHGGSLIDPNTGQGHDFAKILDPASAVYTQDRPALKVSVGPAYNEFAQLGELSTAITGGAPVWLRGPARVSASVMIISTTGHANEAIGISYGAPDDASCMSDGGANTSAFIRISANLSGAPRGITQPGATGPAWEVGVSLGDGGYGEYCFSVQDTARSFYSPFPSGLLPVAGRIYFVEIDLTVPPSSVNAPIYINGYPIMLGAYLDDLQVADFRSNWPDFDTYAGSSGLCCHVVSGKDAAATAVGAFSSLGIERGMVAP